MQDAVLAAQYGCDGIIVSNHGGRQLDGSRPSIVVLQEVKPVCVRVCVFMRACVCVHQCVCWYVCVCAW